MWDDRRKVGILNDFDLAKFTDQAGPSGQDNTGTLPFMALDLLSEEGLRGGILRRYRHEAESFAWSLICLCLSTVEGTDGKNYTRNPHPLLRWFQSWHISRDSKCGLRWDEHDNPDVPLVHSNTKPLAQALHEYWSDRYNKQLWGGWGTRIADDDKFGQDLGLEPSSTEILPYEEPKDEKVFRELLRTHSTQLRSLEATKGVERVVREMGKAYLELDWSA